MWPKFVKAVQNGRSDMCTSSIWVINIVGGKVAQVFQQNVVPNLHDGKIIARECRFQHKRFGVFALATGHTAQHQRQHWGVYGVMPPSAKE